MSKENEFDEESVQPTSVLSTQVNDPGFWRELWQQIRLISRLIRDPEVPTYLKAIPFLGLIYLLSPFDFIADFAPGLGQLDDLTVLLAGSKLFLRFAPSNLVDKHRNEIRAQDGYGPTGDNAKDTIIIDADHEMIMDDLKPDD